MRKLLLIGLLCYMPVAWADYQKTPGTRFDLGELTSEWKRVVPMLSDCEDTSGTITCRRERGTGDFTDIEKAEMDAALLVHDPDIRKKRKQDWKIKKASARTKLEALGLTTQELDALGLAE